jgi:hypothetical protein
MRKCCCLLLMSFAFYGCARLSTPVPYSEAILTPNDRIYEFQKQNEKNISSVVLLRDEGFFGGKCYHGVWFDGKLAAKMEPGEKASFYLEPGEHILKIGNVGSGGTICDIQLDRIQRETSLKPNQIKYFRLLWNKYDGLPDIQPIDIQDLPK